MTRLAGALRAMNDNARYRLQPAAGWHRDVDELRRPSRQAVQFGRGVMAEGGPRPRTQNRRPQQRRPAGFSAERGKDAAVDALPAAAIKPRPDGIPGQSLLERLTAGDHAALKLCLILQARWETLHIAKRGLQRRWPAS